MAHKRREGRGQSRQTVLAGLIEHHGWTSGAELGVYQGETLFYLLRRFPKLSMIGVDHWKRTGGPVQNRETGDAPYYNKPMEEIKDAVFREAEQFPERCRLIALNTVAAAEFVEDGTLDFVFIDADHSTAAVTSDIKLWSPKLKPKGALVGHDANWPSVRRALKVTLGDWIEMDANVWYFGHFV